MMGLISNADLDALAQRNDKERGAVMLRKVTEFLSRFVSYPLRAFTDGACSLDCTHSHDGCLGFDSAPRRGAVAGRCVVRGKIVETEEIPAYSAVALAGIGSLPDTILSRSVIIRMRRRKAGESVEPYRRRLHIGDGNGIRSLIEVWAASMSGNIKWPEMPPDVQDRDADVWEPLLAVADAVGGEWPGRARKAAVALVSASKDSEPSLGILLLTHLKGVFGETDKISTDVILKRLHEIEEAPWRDLKGKGLDDRGLARQLRKDGIKSKTVRIADATPRGYERKDFVDAWSRYTAPSSPPASATSATNRGSVAGSVAHVVDVLQLPAAKRQERVPCAQCRLDDGKQKLQSHLSDPIWLHSECVRFWNGSR